MSFAMNDISKANDQLLQGVTKLAQSLLDNIILSAEVADFVTMESSILKLSQVLKSKSFPQQKAKLFSDFSKEAAITAYIKQSQHMVTLISQAAREKNDDVRQDAIVKARHFIGQAIKSGANSNIYERFEKILNIALLTTKAGIDDVTKRSAMIKTNVMAEQTNAVTDRRKAIRITSPRLSVIFNKIEAFTNDWSMYGLNIHTSIGTYQIGKKVSIQISAVGMNSPLPGFKATVARFDPLNSNLCLEFTNISTEILKIARHLKEIGIKLQQ